MIRKWVKKLQWATLVFPGVLTKSFPAIIYSLNLRGYRSLEDFSLKLAPLTVVQGGNGVGKSNLYKALGLFASLAKGSFPKAIADEGGTQSCLWAGPVNGPKKRREISLDIKAVDFEWHLTFGLILSGPDDPTLFKGDPDIKKETLTAHKDRYTRSTFAREIPNTESLVSFIRDYQNHPLFPRFERRFFHGVSMITSGMTPNLRYASHLLAPGLQYYLNPVTISLRPSRPFTKQEKESF